MSDYCNRCGRPHDYGPCLRDRIVIAAIEALNDGDPIITIGVGQDTVNITWSDSD